MTTRNLTPEANGNHAERIPSGISEYIKKHFDGSFLTEIEQVEDGHGKHIFKVDISHDDTLYHFKFNSEGVIIEKQMEPLYEDDESGVAD